MRRRLIGALVGVAVVSLVLYATPRAFTQDAIVRRQEQHALDRSADLMGQLVAVRLARGIPLDRDFLTALAGEGEQVVVRLPDGNTVRSGPRPAGYTLAVVRPLPDGGEVTLRIATDAVDQRIEDAIRSRLLTGALVVTFAIILATLLARRLSAPFTALVAYADELGSDHERPLPASTVPEAERLARALERSRVRIDDLVQREREFSANASHQLRTPLTALRLRLDDLATWDDTTPPVREELTAALSETDRLASTIDDMLDLARSGAIGERVRIDLTATAREVVARCRPRFLAAGRDLTIANPAEPAVVRASSSALEQVLEVLIENALMHGEGATTVSVSSSGRTVHLRVADEGALDGVGSDTIFARSVRSSTSGGAGIGLALARDITVSSGGELVLANSAPTTFEVTLPRA